MKVASKNGDCWRTSGVAVKTGGSANTIRGQVKASDVSGRSVSNSTTSGKPRFRISAIFMSIGNIVRMLVCAVPCWLMAVSLFAALRHFAAVASRDSENVQLENNLYGVGGFLERLRGG